MLIPPLSVELEKADVFRLRREKFFFGHPCATKRYLLPKADLDFQNPSLFHIPGTPRLFAQRLHEKQSGNFPATTRLGMGEFFGLSRKRSAGFSPPRGIHFQQHPFVPYMFPE